MMTSDYVSSLTSSYDFVRCLDLAATCMSMFIERSISKSDLLPLLVDFVQFCLC